MGEKSDPLKRTRTRKSTAAPDSETAIEAGRTIDGDDDVAAVRSADIDLTRTDGTDESTEQIREEIEETRAQMSGTIDEIQERLSPRRLVNDATETVREAAVGKVRDVMETASGSAGGIVERIKDNPVPAALIGIGAWWLFGGQGNGSPKNVSRRYNSEGTFDRENFRQGYLGAQHRSGGFVDTLKQHPVPAALAGLGVAWWMRDRRQGQTSAYRDDSEWSSDYSAYSTSNSPGIQGGRGSGIRDAASNATDKMSDLAERTQDRVADLAGRTQETVGQYADRAQTEFDRLLRDNPLALGAFAVAVGAAVGMAIPESQREREMMGDMRNQIVDKAQNLAHGAMDKVQQVASNLPGNAGDRS